MDTETASIPIIRFCATPEFPTTADSWIQTTTSSST